MAEDVQPEPRRAPIDLDADEFFESAPDAMVIVDRSGHIVRANVQTERVFGYRREALLGLAVDVLIPERFRQRRIGHRAGYFADPHTRPMGAGLDLCGRRQDGREFPVEISLSPLTSAGELFVSAAIRDITERTHSERLASYFAAVVESSHDAIISKNIDGTVTSWNPAAERLYGYSEAEMIGKSISILVPPGQEDELPQMLRRIRSGERVEEFETIRERKDGTQVEVSLTVSPILDKTDTVVGVSTIARDISARLRYQERLRFLADHDALTGLKNRRRFEREVGDQIGRAKRYGESAAVLLLDVNGLKQINDFYGHRTGDKALRAVATFLRGRLRDTDVIARIGGDEFAILLPHMSEDDAQRLATELRGLLRLETVETEYNDSISLDSGVGFSVINSDTLDDDSVFVDADSAMYADKRASPRRRLALPRLDY